MYIVARVDDEKCIGCKICILSCPDPNVFSILPSKKVAVDENRCKGCGLCASSCPKGALVVS